MNAPAWPDLPIVLAYYLLLGGLCLFSAHRLWLLAEFWWLRRRARFDTPPAPAPPAERLPVVTIQLPLYNEPQVAERLVDAVCAMDYPRERLEIQVLDDSTDETTGRVAAAVARWQARGLDIVHIRRADRTGYKAGALAHGLATSRGELVALFDADFIPGPDFLMRTVGHFDDPQVGMVQTRWGHLNRDASLLTQLQALFLDAHFRIEHAVRSARGRFFNFNGTAGIWRRAAIDDAGGWQHDTLTEDLDLSYRAQLRGWKFLYRDDVVSPAELPAMMTAYRSQQHRWAKGAMETARKILPTIRRSDVPLLVRLDATGHLLGNTAYLMLVALLLLMFPVFLIRESHGLYALIGLDAGAFVPMAIGFALYFGAAARLRGASWGATLLLVPCALALGVGMSLNNARAALEGILGRRSEFVRTPKLGTVTGGTETGRSARAAAAAHARKCSLLPLLEVAMAAHLALLAATAAYYGVAAAMPFAVLFAAGFLYVGCVGFVQQPAAPCLPGLDTLRRWLPLRS